jgi:hypothetical protein
MLTVENGLNELLSVVLNEVSVDYLVNVAVKIVEENGRPLEIEKLILLAFEARRDSFLSSVTNQKLLCCLINRNCYCGLRQRLLEVLCRKDYEGFVKFWEMQPAVGRQKLLPVLKSVRQMFVREESALAASAMSNK